MYFLPPDKACFSFSGFCCVDISRVLTRTFSLLVTRSWWRCGSWLSMKSDFSVCDPTGAAHPTGTPFGPPPHHSNFLNPAAHLGKLPVSHGHQRVGHKNLCWLRSRPASWQADQGGRHLTHHFRRWGGGAAPPVEVWIRVSLSAVSRREGSTSCATFFKQIRVQQWFWVGLLGVQPIPAHQRRQQTLAHRRAPLEVEREAR